MSEKENEQMIVEKPSESEQTEGRQEEICEDTLASKTEEDFSAAFTHPMFASFAKGKRGEITQICRDFMEMLSSESIEKRTATVNAKMTPSFSHAAPDVPLTERQRMIARAAGLSYREYYAALQGIPANQK